MRRAFNIIAIMLAAASSGRAQEVAPVKTDGSDIGISIMGTIIQSKTEDNVALIKEANGTVVALKKGFVTPSKFRVLDINSQYLELKNESGKVYWVYRDKFAMNNDKSTKPVLPPAPAAPSVVIKEDGFERKDNLIRMTEAYRDKIVKEDLSKILMQATAEPYFENGQIVGFLLTQINEGSIYQKSGIMDGDIITKINDQELTSIPSSVKLLQSLKGTKQIEVELRRVGQNIKLKLEVN